MSGAPSAHILLRPIGSPLTVGMSGLAVASLVQSGAELGWIPAAQTHQVGLILIAVPFVLQLIACLLAYLARDGATGAAVGVLATTWLAIGLLDTVSVPGHTSSALGTLLLASGATLALSAVAIAINKPLPAAVFILASLRFGVAGIYQLSAIDFWQHVGGIAGLAISALAGYSVIAFELEGQRGRPVLPTFRRGRAAAALDGAAGLGLDGVMAEAGVRQTT